MKEVLTGRTANPGTMPGMLTLSIEAGARLSMSWMDRNDDQHMTILAHPDVLDQLILWRMKDLRYSRPSDQQEGKKIMQRQWVIEARADFADPDKNEAITEAVRRAAVHINATLALLVDKGIMPEVVAYSDDFFSGHEDIKLLEDTLGKAKAEIDVGAEAVVSSEMMAALRDMKADDA